MCGGGHAITRRQEPNPSPSKVHNGSRADMPAFPWKTETVGLGATVVGLDALGGLLGLGRLLELGGLLEIARGDSEVCSDVGGGGETGETLGVEATAGGATGGETGETLGVEATAGGATGDELG